MAQCFSSLAPHHNLLGVFSSTAAWAPPRLFLKDLDFLKPRPTRGHANSQPTCRGSHCCRRVWNLAHSPVKSQGIYRSHHPVRVRRWDRLFHPGSPRESPRWLLLCVHLTPRGLVCPLLLPQCSPPPPRDGDGARLSLLQVVPPPPCASCPTLSKREEEEGAPTQGCHRTRANPAPSGGPSQVWCHAFLISK